MEPEHTGAQTGEASAPHSSPLRSSNFQQDYAQIMSLASGLQQQQQQQHQRQQQQEQQQNRHHQQQQQHPAMSSWIAHQNVFLGMLLL